MSYIPQSLDKCIATKDFDPPDKVSYWPLKKGEVIYRVSKLKPDLSVCLKGFETKLVPSDVLEDVDTFIQHPFQDGVFIKKNEVFEAFEKQILYYHPMNQQRKNHDGLLRHNFMCCQTFEGGLQCAWKEYRCDPPNIIANKSNEFMGHLKHECIRSKPKFNPQVEIDKKVIPEEVSMLFLVFISCCNISFRQINSEPFYNFIYAVMMLARQFKQVKIQDLFHKMERQKVQKEITKRASIELHYMLSKLKGCFVSVCNDSAKILSEKLTIATIKQAFRDAKPILMTCFKGACTKLNLIRFWKEIYEIAK
ncbi:MAG: hypothetical protein EZS28_019967 [Streblomastix strix]|uniref:Uncharacterized protein n=1 Tax=Streblomastix strix TaxID=222440 RepID=A0A5J4VPL7_9EUKA|nr:MAG: hypothetical protein EZS28_019967 [Streblomastix strix]